jgi:hypothetical protein
LLTRALASQIPEFQSFVQGVERDKTAVKAGLTLPASNGIVEGKVNKLKLIKRMGYAGRDFHSCASVCSMLCSTSERLCSHARSPIKRHQKCARPMEFPNLQQGCLNLHAHFDKWVETLISPTMITVLF